MSDAQDERVKKNLARCEKMEALSPADCQQWEESHDAKLVWEEGGDAAARREAWETELLPQVRENWPNELEAALDVWETEEQGDNLQLQ